MTPPAKPRAKRAKKAPEQNLLEAASERVRAAVREASERSAGDEAA